MESLWPIVGVTLLFAAVLVLSAMVWRLLRAERRRSEARVAALAVAIDELDWQRPAGRGHEAAIGNLTLTPARGLEPSFRGIAFAIAGIVVALGAGAIFLAGGPDERSAAAVVVSAPTTSLELIAMRHAREGDTVIVSGIVRNPSELATPPLTAVISALGPDGHRVARGESRLEPLALGPGKETSFRVTVTSPGAFERYRVSFVDGDHVVPHVDRRGDLARTAMAFD